MVVFSSLTNAGQPGKCRGAGSARNVPKGQALFARKRRSAPSTEPKHGADLPVPARLTLLTGPARSGKTTWLVDRYLSALAEGPPGVGLWLSPTWRAVVEVRGRLLDGRHAGWLAPNVMTFDRFAEATVEGSSVAIRPIDRAMKRQLVRRLLDQQRSEGRLTYFGRIAETSGLIDMLCDWISEMKRLEIWPEQLRRACSARGISQKDRELLALYEAYQQALTEHQLYDAEGRFWSARDWLSQCMNKGSKSKSQPAELPAPWQGLRLVVVDGFSDFTRTQHEILELLGRGVEQLMVSLPLEADAGREDLFAKPRATLQLLRREFRSLEVVELPRADSPAPPALAHLERKLFANPRRVEDAPEGEGLEIIAAAGRVGEIEQVAACIKRLLLEGRARPGEIAVVFRSLSGQSELVREVFARRGIPVALENTERLERCPALRFLVRLLELDEGDWPTEDLLAVLRSNYFRPELPDLPEWQGPGAVRVVEEAIRELGISGGRNELIAGLRRRSAEKATASAEAQTAAETQPGDDSAGQAAAAAGPEAAERSRFALALAVVERLSGALQALPQQAPPAGWARAWHTLAAQLGMLDAIEQVPPEHGELAALDSAGWERLVEVLGLSERMFAWLGEEAPLLDRAQAVVELRDVLAAESLPWSGEEWGKVRVLSAYSVRSLEVPYLFVAGLWERAFPPPERDDRFYGEAEREQLRAQGLPLPARVERSQEEMLLFYEVVTRATRRLYCSYPALDEKSQPLLPSPYLREAEQAMGATGIARTEATDLSPIPEPDRLFAPAEFRVRAMAEALSGKTERLAQWLADPSSSEAGENLLAAMCINQLRQQRDKFSAAEGLLPSEAARSWFAEHYSPERVFRATDLEAYAACPFAFLMERVLKIAPLAEVVEGVDYLERGRRVHEILARFHARVNQQLGRPGSPLELDEQQTRGLLDELIEESFARVPDDPLRAAFFEIDRRVISAWLRGYREQYEKYEAGCRKAGACVVPELFEVSFGTRREGDDPASVDQALECYGVEPAVRIVGRIDRVDTGRVGDQAVLVVVDYKSGGTGAMKTDAVFTGAELQLPLYALAAGELILSGRNPVPLLVGYWRVRDQGFRGTPFYEINGPDRGPKRSAKQRTRDGADAQQAPDQAAQIGPTADWEQIRLDLPKIIGALARGMRRAEFPVFSRNDHCTRNCPFSTLCRINQIRSLEKTWPLLLDES